MPNLKNSLQVSEKLGSQITLDNSNYSKIARSTAKTIDMLISGGFQWYNMVSPNTKGDVIGVGETKNNDNSFINPMSAESFTSLKMYIAKGLNPR